MTAKGWRKRQTEQAIHALETMLAGTQCTPMERDFFIRGYIYGLRTTLDTLQHKHHKEPGEPHIQSDHR